VPLKQKIGIMLCFFILLLTVAFQNFDLSILIVALGLPLLLMGFGPSFYLKVNLPKKYWFIPLCVSISITILFIKEPKGIFTFTSTWESWLMVISFPILLLALRMKECYQTIKIARILDPLPHGEFFRRFILGFWLLVSEEILFRAVFFSILNDEYNSSFIVVLNALLFIYYHYFNRNSSMMYKVKDYIFHGILAMYLSVIFLNTNSLLYCIVGHFIYNSIYFISLSQNTKFARKLFKGAENGESVVK